jgi:hypothetical protein
MFALEMKLWNAIKRNGETPQETTQERKKKKKKHSRKAIQCGDGKECVCKSKQASNKLTQEP